MFVTGGAGGGGFAQSTVWSAPIKSDGTIGAFSTLTYLPQVLTAHSAEVYNGYLFVMGGLQDNTVQSTVYSAPIKADGTIGAFSTLTYLPGERWGLATTTYSGYLFVTGGADAGSAAHSTVWSAPIKSDGTLGAFSTLTYLPQALRLHSSVAYNGYLLVTGGLNAAAASQSTVYSAPIKSDGTIGAFSTLTYLPADRRSHAATIYNGYLLVSGGNGGGSSQTIAWSAPLTTSRAFTFNANSQTWPEGTALGGNASLFTLQNNGDAVANFSATGDLLLRGKLSADSVVLGTDKPGDLAENFPTSDPSIEAGDVVSISSDTGKINDEGLTDNKSNSSIINHQSLIKSSKPYDNKIVGVVSTNPSITLSPKENGKPVALSGRVPIKVSTENGPIEVGDYLTSSSVPGVAMKATHPGQVVGKALEAFPADTSGVKFGKILSFVNVSFADPGNFLANLSLDADGNLIAPKLKVGQLTLDPTLTTTSATIAGLGNKTQVTSNKLNELEERIAALETSVQSATSSAAIASDYTLDLTPPDILYATPSAQLASLTTSEATVSGMLTSYQAQIQDHFKVFGNTTLGNTLIAGDLTIDGTFSISGNSINALSTLYLQNNPLSSLVDIFSGKVTIDKGGNITASTITADQYKINQGKSAGAGKIPAEQTEVIIENPYVSENSIVLVTSNIPLLQNLQTITSKAGFKVKLLSPEPLDINFDYLIIGVVGNSPPSIFEATQSATPSAQITPKKTDESHR